MPSRRQVSSWGTETLRRNTRGGVGRGDAKWFESGDYHFDQYGVTAGLRCLIAKTSREVVRREERSAVGRTTRDQNHSMLAKTTLTNRCDVKFPLSVAAEKARSTVSVVTPKGFMEMICSGSETLVEFEWFHAGCVLPRRNTRR